VKLVDFGTPVKQSNKRVSQGKRFTRTRLRFQLRRDKFARILIMSAVFRCLNSTDGCQMNIVSFPLSSFG